MVQQVVIFCDNCYERDVRTEGTPRRLGIAGRWYEAHLCDACAEESHTKPHAEVVAFFVDHGEIIGNDRSPLGQQGSRFSVHGGGLEVSDMPCLWCDKTYTSSGGLEHHLKTVHGFDDPAQAWGSRCPACGESFTRLASHTQRSHHRHVSMLMQEAAANGDPFGIAQDRARAVRRR